jgi:hypothetical protein
MSYYSERRQEELRDQIVSAIEQRSDCQTGCFDTHVEQVLDILQREAERAYEAGKEEALENYEPEHDESRD